MSKHIRDLQKYLINPVDEVPDEWMSVKDYAKANNIHERVASKQIHAGFQQGILEKKNFKIKTASAIRPIPHYRMIDDS